MKTKHTPGPWYIPTIRANAQDKRPLWETVRSKHTEEPICRIAQDVAHDAEANARLIAAAPELLAALRLLIEWYDGQHGDPGVLGSQSVEDARAAIAKATA